MKDESGDQYFLFVLQTYSKEEVISILTRSYKEIRKFKACASS